MNLELTAAQEDALQELIKMGYGRAVAALSDLTQQRLLIERPTVSVQNVDGIAAALGERIQGEVLCVNQVFTGPITGDAFLLLDRLATISVSDLLLERTNSDVTVPDEERREIIGEVGNILLNACLGAFGNLLKVQMSFAVPHMRVGGMESTVDSMSGPNERLAHALMMHTRFQNSAGKACGNMVLLLGFITLERLLAEIESWDRQAKLI